MKKKPPKTDASGKPVEFIGAFIPSEIRATLKEMAAANRRSVSAEITFAIEERVAKWLAEKENAE